jgi:tetratricopeptide (TPR) repeat protein
LVSKYFKGRSDVLEHLAKNYYELFCKEATKKDRPFREFVVIELGKLANQGVITDEAVKTVERHIEGIIEELQREKEASSRQFIITDDLKAVGSEILAGEPPIEYVERKELEKVKGALKTTNKLLVVGKPGAGKSRFLLRILAAFNGYERFVVIRSFFREDGIRSLDAELQQLNSFILVWDDLHRVKNEIVNQTINQVEQLAKEYEKRYMFIGVSRMEGEYYQFKQEEIKLDDFRSLELIEKCSAYFGVSVDGGVKEKLLEVGDGTPFYVISLFTTSKERGKKRLMEDDLKALPDDSFTLCRDHLNFLESEGRLNTSEKNVLRSIALAMRAVPVIEIEMLEKFYAQIFRGDLSKFDYALDNLSVKFFISSMHAVQAAVVEERYPTEERKIIRLRELLISQEREKSIWLLGGFAIWFYKKKEYNVCLKFLDVFIEKEPNLAEAYNDRANAYAGLNQHERAIPDFDKSVEINPNYAGAYYNRGNSYAKLNKYERAIQDYDKAIELNPNLIESYVNRGNSYAELNRHKRAIQEFNKALELNPDFTEAYVNRGKAYTKLNQRERAIRDYDKAIELNPNYAKAYNNRGVVYDELSRHERAIRDYDKALELNPNYAEAYNNRGVVYDELSRHERAIRDYNKAIELNPNYAKAYNNRAVVYDELSRHERAIRDYNKAIELNPDYAEAYGNRGIAKLKISNYKESARDLNKGGVLFFKLRREEDAKRAFLAGFNLREEIVSDNIVYCGLALFLITLNPDVIIELRQLRIEDETLREIFELTLMKLRDEDISDETAMLEEEEKRKEMNILLELLRNL